MDRSYASVRRAQRSCASASRTCIGLVVMSAVSAGVLAQQAGEPMPPLDIDAEWGSFDRTGSRFRGLRMTQGELIIEAAEAVATGLDPETSEWRLEGNVRMGADLGVIQADEAAGNLDFAGNQWRFSGNVRILFGTAVLEADEARFAFRAQRLAAGELTGTPAVFEDRSPAREEIVRGTANRLRYDAEAQTLHLSENVRIQVGPNEYSGCELIYDFGHEAVTAGSSEGCGEPLHFRFQVPDASAETLPPP